MQNFIFVLLARAIHKFNFVPPFETISNAYLLESGSKMEKEPTRQYKKNIFACTGVLFKIAAKSAKKKLI